MGEGWSPIMSILFKCLMVKGVVLTAPLPLVQVSGGLRNLRGGTASDRLAPEISPGKNRSSQLSDHMELCLDLIINL